MDMHASFRCSKTDDAFGVVFPKEIQKALTLVYTKKGVDALEQWLYTDGFPATIIHGDRRTQHEREQAIRSFKEWKLKTPILVTTDVATRDLHHIPHSTLISLDNDIDDYVRRIRRTRKAAGKSRLAI
ncbi:hypothetical protein CUMW_003900 [Citrus unshiu]|nr:hypothetical protein CUMW_003900 [Citrus unshiu]